MIGLAGIFLMDILRLFGFPDATCHLIRHCLTTSTLAVLWNGERTDIFKPSRGLHQSNPLSPYLFVLYLERLSMLIQQAMAEKKWVPFLVCRNGPCILNLFFANDLLLFMKANVKQANVVKNTIQAFCQVSSLNVSGDKSVAFCSPYVPFHVKNDIQCTTRICFTEDLGRYLGVLLMTGRSTKCQFEYIIEKVQKRLSS